MNTLVSFKMLIQTFRKYLITVILLVVIGAVLGFVIDKFAVTPHYESTTTVVVNREDKGEYGTLAEALTQNQADTQMLTTYKDLLTKPVILDSVRANLSKAQQNAVGEDLSSAVTVDNTANSRVFTITVRTNDAKVSAVVANKIVATFKSKIGGIVDNAKSISVVEKAVAAKSPSSSQKKLFVLGGALLGLLIGFCIALSDLLFSNKIKTLSYFKSLELPVWGEMVKED